MMQKPFFYEAKSDKEVDIHIYGEIGWDETYFEEGTNNVAFALVSLIKRLSSKYARLNVHINSPGGFIDDGLAIYNTLKNVDAEIHTYNNGLVASMASIIMLSGTTHFPKTSVYHLHSASTVTQGNIKDHEQQIESLKVFESALQNAIASKTNLTIEDIQANWFDGKDHYMTAEQAHEYGFVDFLEDSDAKPPAAKNELEKMDYEQIISFYNNEQKSKNNFFNNIKSKIFTNSNSKSNKMANPITFKAKLTFLLALVGLSEFILNANNKIEINIDDAFKINDSLEQKDAENASLKQEIEDYKTTLEQNKSEIDILKAKLNGTPLKDVANPKTKDNSQADTKASTGALDEETSKALADYNKANLY